MLRGSQVCSALQATLRSAFGLAYGHRCAALGQPALGYFGQKKTSNFWRSFLFHHFLA